MKVYYLSEPEFDRFLADAEAIELIMKYCLN